MSDHDSLAGVDLRTLFRADAATGDRAKALTEFVSTVRARLQGVASAAGQGTDAIAERGGQLLAEMVDRLPIRRADELRQQYGATATARAAGVIDDAATLASWLWRAAKTIPAQDATLHPAKVVLHSAIEIRMVGELLEAHRDSESDPTVTPLPAVLAAWFNGGPGTVDWSVSSVSSILVAKVRRALTELRSHQGIIQTWRTKGDEGATVIRSLGEQLEHAIAASARP